MASPNKMKPKPNPFPWVVEPLQDEPGYIDKAMFGCRGIYLYGKLMLVLCSGAEPWNGLLIPTDFEFHDSIRKEFKAVKQHPVLKKWLYLHEQQEEFESMAQDIVDAIRMNDQRFGVEPNERKNKKK